MILLPFHVKFLGCTLRMHSHSYTSIYLTAVLYPHYLRTVCGFESKSGSIRRRTKKVATAAMVARRMRGALVARYDWLAHVSCASYIAYTQSHLTKLILLL